MVECVNLTLLIEGLPLFVAMYSFIGAHWKSKLKLGRKL